MPSSNTSIIYLKHPTEFPVVGEHFAAQTNKDFKPVLKDGEVLTRNLVISLDPYMRGKMRDTGKQSYSAAFEIGKPLDARGIAEVIESKNDKYPVGSIIHAFVGWEEYTVLPDLPTTRIIPEARESKLPLSSYVGVLGMPGLTAYASLKDIGRPKAGETIFISAASGAVGQLAGQLAKVWGLTVIGSAGSDEKVDYLLKEVGFDKAFNYKKRTAHDALKELAPKGIDIYFENVGGETLEAALDNMNTHGRVIACGMISQYNTTKPYGIKNLMQVVSKRLTIRGFIVADFQEQYFADFFRDVKALLLENKIVYKTDEAKGIEAAPEAFVGLLQGKNFGKQVVKVADL
ncbi:hypothetical protein BC939DRAFT_450093 [Gamsiella multidivaricata]|uniref:uncharacterized protein n=1 Tax=Gamsiella multidivaricata TaxID=101098 RepID=UPI00222026A8|nr:uncharacterized protein BC939DRAFT_450093 [Gamsiella multidivaricata]KAG0367435.1 hypothetical protein BGZ54_003892 [Gamsiella multidivaricata]KAI7824340.1 hypothetical protein BC939DRAFT_450093 [Gamsiella multidivaricata]